MKEKKVKISITIDEEQNKRLEETKINKSKLVNWLLQNYYGKIK